MIHGRGQRYYFLRDGTVGVFNRTDSVVPTSREPLRVCKGFPAYNISLHSFSKLPGTSDGRRKSASVALSFYYNLPFFWLKATSMRSFESPYSWVNTLDRLERPYYLN
ncbi:hypothetical protein K503DRAFT_783307 [Rhizopogon vinicolor AM-OR11-026]|uniref:Uncharacterized protein n=1 Tax=Rhizopogon vinicolor AM-OR11-026 TaxID=1314800 RepID=A0A1B7MZ90_9AGAM|nr:hypothetical protein K503DRAFT_783307 [Rhizopogon vinicolor AM-OR11-026]